MYSLIFWIALIFFIIGMLMAISYGIGKVIFVILYGEQIRQLIINMPEYKPSWFAIVNLQKPIKPWHLVRITFFVLRLFGVVFTKHTTVVNEEFKSKLPSAIINWLKVLQFLLYGGAALIFIPYVYFWIQQN